MTTTYLVFNPKTLYILRKADGNRAEGCTLTVAKRIVSNAIKKGKIVEGEFIIGTYDDFALLNKFVEVESIMGGKAKIRKSEQGTCTDPSTETYWSM